MRDELWHKMAKLDTKLVNAVQGSKTVTSQGLLPAGRMLRFPAQTICSSWSSGADLGASQ